MESVGTIVDGQLIVTAVNAQMSAGNAVGISSGHLAGAWTVGYIIGGVGITECHVIELS